MKEKITLKFKGSRYVVQSLENRMAPPVGTALTPESVESLLLEAKTGKVLTVKIS